MWWHFLLLFVLPRTSSVGTISSNARSVTPTCSCMELGSSSQCGVLSSVAACDFVQGTLSALKIRGYRYICAWLFAVIYCFYRQWLEYLQGHVCMNRISMYMWFQTLIHAGKGMNIMHMTLCLFNENSYMHTCTYTCIHKCIRAHTQTHKQTNKQTNKPTIGTAYKHKHL